MLGKCCTFSCLSYAFYIFSTIVILVWARAIYDVSILAPAFSEQWYAEMWWWTKWMFIRGVQIAPLPTTYLQHAHSEIKVLELYPENDANAFKKFLECADSDEFDDTVCILRNVWSNYTENKIQYFNNSDHFREMLNTSEVYNHISYAKGAPPEIYKNDFSTILDLIEEDNEIATGLIFDFEFLEKNEYLNQVYTDLWKNLDEELAARIANTREKASISHTFVYHGSQMHSAMHAGFLPDYFLQVANEKRWKFMNKRYIPYVGLRRTNKFGTTITPFYLADGYPLPGIPHTEIILKPGDLMYFSTWHPHEVSNVHADRFGFAIGIRATLGPMFSERFWPQRVFNIMSLPNLAGQIFAKNSFDGWKLNLLSKCENPSGLAGYIPSFNGSRLTRFDMKRIDGECHLKERQKDYQAKEILNEWGLDTWKPVMA